MIPNSVLTEKQRDNLLKFLYQQKVLARAYSIFASMPLYYTSFNTANYWYKKEKYNAKTRP